MSSIDEKLKKFKESSTQMATDEANILKKEINEEIDRNIKEEVSEYEKERRKEHTKKMERLEQKYNSEIFQTENNARYQVLKRQDELKEQLFQKITAKIKEFSNGKEYLEFLKKNIEQTITNLKIENGDNASIKITKRDWEKYGKELKEKFNMNFETIEDSNFGGSLGININKQILIDNTLKTQISEFAV